MKLESTNANADPAAQARRRRSAILGAVFSTLYRILTAGVLLWMRESLEPGGFWAKVVLVLLVLDLGSIIPIWISLRTRLKEIQGGEEDAAAQY